MSLSIHLLGHPNAERPGEQVYRFRSRKTWALLVYLLLSDRPPSRTRLASLLFADAEDPLRALRWGLTELRRCLGDDGTVEGDPVVLSLGPGVRVDVDTVMGGAWDEAVRLPGLGSEMLEGTAVRGAPVFEAWLLSQQRHIASASEATLHEAAVGSMSRGRFDDAIGYATRVLVMAPFDENHYALLIRLYRLVGDDDSAERQFASCVELFEKEFGVAPGPAVQAAFRATRARPSEPAGGASIAAVVEAGAAAVAAGAIEVGVDSLRVAVRLADAAGAEGSRVRARLVLAEALVHSLRGLDEEGVGMLHEADGIAEAAGDRDSMARARAELGYVDFLRARYDRAEMWLTESLDLAGRSDDIRAKATTYLGSVESDRANYPGAIELLEEAVGLSRDADQRRQEVVGLSMIGRVHLLRGDLDEAAESLEAAIALAEREHWLAYLPWPQSLLGEVQLARRDGSGAATIFEQAFARACQLGDPCWEGMSARGLALVAESAGELDRSFEILDDALARSGRLPDSYVWLDAYILDARCGFGLRHGHPDTAGWVDRLGELASRTGMRELVVRSMLHGAALGRGTDLEAARMLAAGVANPVLHRLIDEAATARV